MLLFCRRMCHQLLLASKLFPFYLFFANKAIHFTLLLLQPFGELHKSLFLKSVLCSCTKISHGQRLYISVRLHKGRLVLLYPPHPTPSLIFSN